MKIVKGILYGFMVLFALLCGIIVLCAVKPELSGQIADTFRLGEERDGEVATVSGIVSSEDQDESIGSSNGYFQDLVLNDEPGEDIRTD